MGLAILTGATHGTVPGTETVPGIVAAAIANVVAPGSGLTSRAGRYMIGGHRAAVGGVWSASETAPGSAHRYWTATPSAPERGDWMRKSPGLLLRRLSWKVGDKEGQVGAACA